MLSSIPSASSKSFRDWNSPITLDRSSGFRIGGVVITSPANTSQHLMTIAVWNVPFPRSCTKRALGIALVLRASSPDTYSTAANRKLLILHCRQLLLGDLSGPTANITIPKETAITISITDARLKQRSKSWSGGSAMSRRS